jgi:hypothetical protein
VAIAAASAADESKPAPKLTSPAASGNNGDDDRQQSKRLAIYGELIDRLRAYSINIHAPQWIRRLIEHFGLGIQTHYGELSIRQQLCG